MLFGFSRYRYSDWMRLRPLTHVYKDMRLWLKHRRLLKMPAPDVGAQRASQKMTGQRVLVTIAFGDAELVDWQTQLVRRHVPNALHVIADNSPTAESSAAVFAAAQCNGATIFRLPANPWTGRAPARSHGFALNWTWENVIRPGRPAAFGFIDHDIFPTAPTDPFAALGDHVAYGVRRQERGTWYIWPGFCFFRFAAVENVPLNFSPNYLGGVETGGANWDVLYRHLSPDQFDVSDFRNEFVPNLPREGGAVQWHDAWVHIQHHPHASRLVAAKRRYVESMLAPQLVGS